ncbi:transporter [Sinorhizobium alkalisoli]|nr:transporter [Sinorhizobium alkalisoli]
MTQAQAFAFAILIGLMVAFIWGRLRYDLIAVLALLAAVFASCRTTQRSPASATTSSSL